MHRQIDRLLDRLDQIVGGIGGEQRGHVLDADRVRAHVGEALWPAWRSFQWCAPGNGIADRGLRVFAGFLDGAHRHHEVARVVQRVEHAEDIDAVDGHAFDAFSDDVVSVVTVAEN